MNCTAGVCTATAANAVLNIHDLEAMLASSNVAVETGTIASSIVTGVFSWASAHNLTLDANKSITVNHTITVSGSGALNLITNDGGSGGKFSFGAAGNIVFWDMSSLLTINGVSYTLVSNIADLASVIAANPSGNFALAKSYDASVDGAYSGSPVPTTYDGNFQGLGNTISRLQIRDSTTGPDVGLFTHIGSSGSVQNLRMTLLNIRPRAGKSGGGLVGTNDGSLSGDSVAGTLTGPAGKAYVGMLAGTNNGVIDSSAASGTVSGSEQLHASTGGLVGRNEAGAISNSSSSGTVSRGNDLGGLVGTLDAGTISNSSSSATIPLSGGAATGGLVGRVYGTISHSHATGSVASYDAGGGLVGDVQSSGMVNLCYATGDVAGDFAGGLVGTNEGSISKSFATGNVTPHGSSSSIPLGGLVGFSQATIADSYSTGSVSGGGYAGGLVGENGAAPVVTGTITSSYSTGPATGATFNGGFVGHNRNDTGQGYTHTYWDTTTSGTTQAVGTGNSAPITGLTTSQLQSGLPAGFDPSIWARSPSINNGFPYLKSNPPPPQAMI